MEDVFRHIEGHQHEAIDELIRLCRLPSVSAEGRAIEETAELVSEMLRSLGFRTQILPKASGHPVVYGELAGASRGKTLLFYNHYDVQPAEPLDLWSSPPFEPALRGDKLYGRGVCDNKGNIVARLAAIRAFQAVRGQVPLSLKFCIEGDEEIGSPGIEPFVEEHRELLAADACLWEGGGVNWQGQPQITLGVKGLLYVELEARGANRDAHSSYATVVPNPAWRLAWALATLKDPQENILIDGFYQRVRPPSPQERAAVEAMSPQEEETARSLGIDGFLKGVRGLDYRLRHLFEPTCNIAGLSSGYQGPGTKTVLPARATAKLDFRLVPDQDPEDVLEKFQRHLRQKDYGDVEVRCLSAERPARTPMDHPFVSVVSEAARQVYGQEPVIIPSMAGTGPLYPFVKTLALPTTDCGIGYPESRIHAPNENIRLADFLHGAKHIAAVLEGFAREQA
jgi:acetylornithine deacetylase/succinyl-diaminopimelate desuccinylase-like protein